MGKFALAFNDLPTPTIVVPARDRRSDGLLQRCIAYGSYYTMVFVAFCAFMPAKVAFATGSLAGMIL